MTDPLLLTDDEVAALAATRSATWPGGTPTLDLADHEQAAAAAFRGSRSLLVRGLRGEVGQGSEVEAMAEVAISAAGAITVYLGSSDFRRVGWGLASSHYAGDSDWLLETISPVGIHRLGWQPAHDHLVFLEALLQAAVDAGPETAGETTKTQAEWLCMLAVGPRGATLTAAKRGSIVIGPVELDDGRPTAPNLETSDPTAAIARLETEVAGVQPDEPKD